MKKNLLKSAAACGLCLTLLSASVSAAYSVPTVRTFENRFPQQTMNQLPHNQQQNPDFNKMDGRMIISEPGDYTLTGDMRGTVFVDPGEGNVKLTLDGARLDGADGPAIVAVSGDRLDIRLADGSRNNIAGDPGSDLGEAIYSEVPVFFEGEGRLDLSSESRDAIRVENGDLSFNGGDIRVDAGQNGFDANNVNFNGGKVAMDAGQNNYAPRTNSNQNGGNFDRNWIPGGDFMQAQQPSGMMARQTPDNEQNSPMGGQISNQIAPGAPMGGQNNSQAAPTAPMNEQNGDQTATAAPSGEQNSQMPGNMQNSTAAQSSGTATEVVTGTVTNSAMELEADYDNATTIVVTNDNSTVKISDSGTYVVAGSADDGSITVKKGTTDVVLILDNLDLTSTSGAALSINKEAEVQVMISGTVTLTDNENPDDEYSTDADVADAYDGAAIKVKAGATVYITGSGTLNVNGNAKNGIKAGDEASLIIGGEALTVNVSAVNDGINGNYDVTILSGTINVSAGDDGIHADRILTIGDEATHTGPDLTIKNSNEGLEGTVVNIAGGKVNVTATDDGINAANSDGLYEGELDYSVNITGGDVTVNTKADGIDSNGNVNLIGGSALAKGPGSPPPEKESAAVSTSQTDSSESRRGGAPQEGTPSRRPDTDRVPDSEKSRESIDKQSRGEKPSRKPDAGNISSQSGETKEKKSEKKAKKDKKSTQTGETGTTKEKKTKKSENASETESGKTRKSSQKQSSAPTDYAAANTLSQSATNATYTSTNDSENAVLVSGGKVTLTGVTVEKTGDGSGDSADFYGINATVLAANGAELTIKGANITSNGAHANGVFSYGEGTTVKISDSAITTTGNTSGGLMTTGGGTMIAENLTVKTSGNSSAAIRSDRGGGTVTVNGGSYESNGVGSPAIYSTADITVNGATLTSTASEGVIVEGKNSVTLNNVTLTDTNTKHAGKSSTDKNIFLYQSMSGDASVGTAEFKATDSKIVTNQGDTIYVTNTTAEIELKNNQLVNTAFGALLRVEAAKWGTAGENGGDVTLELENQKAAGDIILDALSTLTMKIEDGSVYTGAVNNANTAKKADVTLETGSKWTLTGDSYVSSLSGNTSGIDLNGHTLYVDGVAWAK